MFLPSSRIRFRGLLSTSIGLFQRKDNLGSRDMKHCPQMESLRTWYYTHSFFCWVCLELCGTQEDRRLQQQRPMLGGSFMSGSFHFKWSKNSPLKEGSWLQIPNQIVGPSLCNTLNAPLPSYKLNFTSGCWVHLLQDIKNPPYELNVMSGHPCYHLMMMLILFPQNAIVIICHTIVIRVDIYVSF